MRSVLNDYQIATQVPRTGGMGLVYRARRMSGQTIALKIIPLRGTPESEAVVRSARRGAAVQKLLAATDRHVPRVYDFGDKLGVFFIEMEYIEGEDLSSILARAGRLPPREATRIAFEVAAFLDVAHQIPYGDSRKGSAELVHSDLKPSNIRIARGRREVKILDFGIAQAGWDTGGTNQFGSVPYMSPERIEGLIDRHADYWALGVALYEMLAGRLPFAVPSGSSSLHRLQQLILSRQPPPPLPPNVPPPLQAVVMRMLHGDPVRRYQDAGVLKSDLKAIMKGRSPAVLRTPMAHDGDTILVMPVRSAPAWESAPDVDASDRAQRHTASRVAGLTRLTTARLLALHSAARSAVRDAWRRWPIVSWTGRALQATARTVWHAVRAPRGPADQEWTPGGQAARGHDALHGTAIKSRAEQQAP